MTGKAFDSNKEKEIVGVTFDHAEDRVSIYGNVVITRDKEGLEKLRLLMAELADIEQVLTSEDLPDQQGLEPVVEVDNPFM